MTITDDGYEALLFTAGGDMRQAINSLQATHAGTSSLLSLLFLFFVFLFFLLSF